MRLIRLAILLAALATPPAWAKIDRHATPDPSAATPGGVKVELGAQPLCWLDGRRVLDESDPYLMSFGQSGLPGVVVMQGLNGRSSAFTVVRRMPAECFEGRRR